MEKKRKKPMITIVLSALLPCLLVLFICAAWKFIKAEIQIGTPEKHPGYIGTLTVSSVKITVPVILVDDPDMVQIAVDKINCAALVPVNDTVQLIGDHNYQKFKNLPQTEIGAEATIANSDGTITKYIVTQKFYGHNVGSGRGGLTDEAGKPISNEIPGGIFLYTCMDTSENVLIVFLQPVE